MAKPSQDEIEQEEVEVGDVDQESEVSESSVSEEQEPDDATEDVVSEADDQGDPDEVIVTIGDESPEEEEQARAPEWVRDLRKKNREDQRRIRELEAQLQSVDTAKQDTHLGEKPTLEDHDYDTDSFESSLAEWYEKKRKFDDLEKQKQAEVQAQEREWQNRLEDYAKSRDGLKVKDYDDSEGIIQDTLSVTQQGIIIQGAKNPALVVYALGKNPKKAQEMAEITDPIKFAFAISNLERDLKVTNRKSPPPPEKVVSGASGVSTGGVDSTLARLREEADRTGDMSKVIAYKRKTKTRR